jgi:hypothetical protein
MMRSANCTSRRLLSCELITPKFAVPCVVFGYPNRTRLKTLKNSERNWSLIFPPMLMEKFLNIDVSQFATPGEVNVGLFIASLPKDPIAG